MFDLRGIRWITRPLTSVKKSRWGRTQHRKKTFFFRPADFSGKMTFPKHIVGLRNKNHKNYVGYNSCIWHLLSSKSTGERISKPNFVRDKIFFTDMEYLTELHVWLKNNLSLRRRLGLCLI